MSSHRYDHGCGCQECTDHENTIAYQVDIEKDLETYRPNDHARQVRSLLEKRDPRVIRALAG